MRTEPVIIAITASAIFLASYRHGTVASAGTWFRQDLNSLGVGGLYPYYYWYVWSAGMFFIVPFAIAFLTGGSFANSYGLRLGNWKLGLTIVAACLAVMIPLTALASTWSNFSGVYPLAREAAYTRTLPGEAPYPSLGVYVSYELAYLAYFIGWEFIYRGWMVHGFAATLGAGPAIAVQLIPFVLMHAQKPELEGYGSIIAGVVLAMLSLTTRSMWYGVLLHVAVAWWMDFLVVRSVLFGIG